MAAFYADENVPLPVVESLRSLGHDLLTAFEAGQANQRIPDHEVLAFAARQDRALLTHNRRDFIKLHAAEGTAHAGLVVCTVDSDASAMASRIHRAVADQPTLKGVLLRVNREV